MREPQSIFGAALGEIGVKEVAEHREDGADQDRREPAELRNRYPPRLIPTIVMMMPKIFDAKATSSFV